MEPGRSSALARRDGPASSAARMLTENTGRRKSTVAPRSAGAEALQLVRFIKQDKA